MKGRWVSAQYFASGIQEAIDAGLPLNPFAAQLLAESLEHLDPAVQAGGVTIRVHDHHRKPWYVTVTTADPEVIEETGAAAQASPPATDRRAD